MTDFDLQAVPEREFLAEVNRRRHEREAAQYAEWCEPMTPEQSAHAHYFPGVSISECVCGAVREDTGFIHGPYKR